jgi:hypothetical protein
MLCLFGVIYLLNVLERIVLISNVKLHAGLMKLKGNFKNNVTFLFSQLLKDNVDSVSFL